VGRRHLQRGCGGKSNLVQQVIAACREQETAIRRDLIGLGCRFDDGSLHWIDLHAVIFAAPPGTAVYHAVEKGWSVSDHKLTDLIDLTKWAVWLQTQDGHDNKNRPEPDPRPTDKPVESPKTAAAGESVASVMTIAEFNKRRARGIKRWRKRHGLDVKGG
jgi:hypothetical protein